MRIIMDNCNVIEKLQGKKLGVIDRASSMLCLGFGSKYIDDTYKRIHNLEVYEFRIHVQCAWRIVNNRLGNIIVASEDIYEPKENCIVLESFDWELKDNNMFDYKAKKWFESTENIYVDRIYINKFKDLSIDFSDNSTFQTFLNYSSDSECWRIFGKDIINGVKLPHFVVCGNDL